MNVRFLFVVVLVCCYLCSAKAQSYYSPEYPDYFEGYDKALAKAKVKQRHTKLVTHGIMMKGVAYYDSYGRDTLVMEAGKIVERTLYSDTGNFYSIQYNYDDDKVRTYTTWLNKNHDVVAYAGSDLRSMKDTISYTYTYDIKGKILSRTSYCYGDSCSSYYYYNIDGQLANIKGTCRLIGEDSAGIAFEYNGNNKLIHIYQVRDSRLFVDSVICSKPGVIVVFRLRYLHDIRYYYNKCRLVKITYFDASNTKLIKGTNDEIMLPIEIKYTYNRKGLIQKFQRGPADFFFTYTYRK